VGDAGGGARQALGSSAELWGSVPAARPGCLPALSSRHPSLRRRHPPRVPLQRESLHLEESHLHRAQHHRGQTLDRPGRWLRVRGGGSCLARSRGTAGGWAGAPLPGCLPPLPRVPTALLPPEEGVLPWQGPGEASWSSGWPFPRPAALWGRVVTRVGGSAVGLVGPAGVGAAAGSGAAAAVALHELQLTPDLSPCQASHSLWFCVFHLVW